MPGVSFDLRELELCVIWIHAFYFLTSWSPEYLKHKKIIHNFREANETNVYILYNG